MASKFNFNLDQGADNTVEITYSPNGVDFLLTGWSIRAVFRAKRSGWHSFELSTASGTIVINGAVIVLNFSPISLADANGVYSYDVIATNGSAVRKIVEGTVTVTPAITR